MGFHEKRRTVHVELQHHHLAPLTCLREAIQGSFKTGQIKLTIILERPQLCQSMTDTQTGFGIALRGVATR